MKIDKLNLVAGIEKYFLIVAACTVFVALLFRNSGIYMIVQDEYIYDIHSRFLPFSFSDYPNYLYFLIYRATNICGSGFQECARVLNGLFFVAAAPFIYLTARKVCTKNLASLVTLLALLGPVNCYTAYFMPESMYFLSFWIFTWFVLQLEDYPSIKSWCLAGMLFGLLALVKPHALFISPAIAAYILFVSRNREGKWVRQVFPIAGVFFVFTIATKLSFSYLLVGLPGITVFGTEYSSFANSAVSNGQHFIDLFFLSLESLKGHVLAVCLMFGLPIAMAMNACFESLFAKDGVRLRPKVSFYALSVLLCLVIVVSLFTASIVGTGPYDLVTRLYMRYYNFIFPLFMIIAASQVSVDSRSSKFNQKVFIAFPIGVAILYAIYTKMDPYILWFVDSPELSGFVLRPKAFYFLGGVSFLALASWVYRVSAGAKIYVFVFLPLAVLVSSFNVSQELRQHIVPDVFSKAGIFANQYLSNDELSKLIVVGPNIGSVYKALFYVDNSSASFQIVPKGGQYDLSTIPQGYEWVLAVYNRNSDKDLITENPFFKLPMDGFTLIHARDSLSVDFRKDAWPGVLTSVRGLCAAQEWGSWSTADVVKFNFSMPLPEKFTVHLVAHTSEQNIGKLFTVNVGNSAAKFELGALPSETVLRFDNPEKSKIMAVNIGSIAQLKDLEPCSDHRTHGIAFTELTILPL